MIQNAMRQRLSLDRNWRFALGHAADPSKDFEFVRDRSLVKAGEARGAAAPGFDDSAWQRVDLPHDWAIDLPLAPSDEREICEHGFRAIGPDHPQHSVGWYRRAFDLPDADRQRRITVQFDGVFRDSVAWLNGHRLGRHASGYVPFRYDLTDIAVFGARNVLVVRADTSSWEGWWYEGAGIYRHVWLIKTAPLHVAHDGTFVTCKVGAAHATVTIHTEVVNEADAEAEFRLRSTVEDPAGRPVAHAMSRPLKLGPWQNTRLAQRIHVRRPRLWSCDHPNLYRLRSQLIHGERNTPRAGERVVDECLTPFGIRTVRWDARRGFFLNGQPLKIKGTCNHSQHAGVGVAMPDRLHAWRLHKLKQLGSNAYRCSHYMVAPELLDECDRLGLLVMAENRLASSSPGNLADFETMIRRDRNHPSIILWSIGNEEHTIQWSAIGERIGRTLMRAARRLDPTRKVTAAMHDRGLGEGFANVVDVHGWNYINVGDIDAHHARRPDLPILGSEEASTVTTRGQYADEPARGYVSAYDRRHPKWGATAERWWRFFSDRPWLAGAFVWTGFDYLGEPIPYKWPCTGSHFGLMDLCGFEKDLHWYYRAWWRPDSPVLHLFPHWNWQGREGQPIEVWCYCNGRSVELALNGRSIGSQDVPRNGHVAWTIPYKPGRLQAVARFEGGRTLRRCVETTGPVTALRLTPDRRRIAGDGRDLAVVTVSAVDDAGRFVPTAANPVEFALDGPARVIGVGNGDPSSHESHKAMRRSLFNGLAQVLVQSDRATGTVTLRAVAAGLTPAECRLQLARARPTGEMP